MSAQFDTVPIVAHNEQVVRWVLDILEHNEPAGSLRGPSIDSATRDRLKALRARLHDGADPVDLHMVPRVCPCPHCLARRDSVGGEGRP